MKEALKALAVSPLAYIVGFAVGGALCVVLGVAMLAGAGWALVALGAFLLNAAWFVSKGLKANG